MSILPQISTALPHWFDTLKREELLEVRNRDLPPSQGKDGRVSYGGRKLTSLSRSESLEAGLVGPPT
ncbi:hypothetical protein [Metallosphaera hakonensis]|uniref:hypothetical protein n=1 Tax=Metallosphaera hakonensis TaxID=79601 RepID=UPI00209247FE|nr:hypothetical protein [Metallosphaera hakonensis]